MGNVMAPIQDGNPMSSQDEGDLRYTRFCNPISKMKQPRLRMTCELPTPWLVQTPSTEVLLA